MSPTDFALVVSTVVEIAVAWEVFKSAMRDPKHDGRMIKLAVMSVMTFLWLGFLAAVIFDSKIR